MSPSPLVFGRWRLTAGLVGSVGAQLHKLAQSITDIVEPLVQLALHACLFVFDARDLLLQRIKTML